MKAPAIIASVTIACSLGFAAGQGRLPAPPQAPMHPSLTQMSGGKQIGSHESGVAMQVGGDGECTIGEPLNWFTNVHVLPECVGGVFISPLLDGLYVSDVDGDGRQDQIILFTTGAGEGLKTYYQWSNYSYEPFPEEVGLYRMSRGFANGESTTSYQSVMSGSVLNAAVCAIAPCNSPQLYVSATPHELSDWDGDGDLDLVLTIYWSIVVPDGPFETGIGVVLVENTAKSHPRLAADINQDGVVDGKDLASVLSAWSH